MSTVTIAATYGAGGSLIGPAVAKRLKLPFVDRAIPTSLVDKIHEPLVAALADDSESGSAAGRVLNSALSYSGLFVGVPMPAEQMGVVPDVTKTEEAIRGLADGGGAVILGRAGVFVLKIALMSFTSDWMETSKPGGAPPWRTKGWITRAPRGRRRRQITRGVHISPFSILGPVHGRKRVTITWCSTAPRFRSTPVSN
jgi:Cytidylate kinase-like family